MFLSWDVETPHGHNIIALIIHSYLYVDGFITYVKLHVEKGYDSLLWYV